MNDVNIHLDLGAIHADGILDAELGIHLESWRMA
jgi:hypothetical protein